MLTPEEVQDMQAARLHALRLANEAIEIGSTTLSEISAQGILNFYFNIFCHELYCQAISSTVQVL